VPGVIRTRVGYCGGEEKSPTYDDLGDHSEAIQIEFDTTKTTYEKLLDVFWGKHTPSNYMRQYRSAIFYHGDDQKKLADQTAASYEKKNGTKAPTAIEKCGDFYLAEGYHQKYYLKHSGLMKGLKFDSEDDMTHSPAATRLNGYVGGNGNQKQLEEEVESLGLSDTSKIQLRDLVKRTSPKSCS